VTNFISPFYHWPKYLFCCRPKFLEVLCIYFMLIFCYSYATIKDVRTGGHDDRMDSFVLAETFKYLYLLFAKPSDLLLDLDEFVFTTEAHLLPLTLARGYNHSFSSLGDSSEDVDSEFARTCPNTLNLFPESVRLPLKNMVDGICPRRLTARRLYGAQFTAGGL